MPSSLGPSEGAPIHNEQEIVTFVEDGAISVDLITPAPPAPTYLDAEDLKVNSVLSFLQRPIIFKTELWSTTDGPMAELADVRLPRNWINNPMIREKLSGFRYLKCDFKIRVQVNAMPFMAGRLLMYFDPLYSQMTLTNSASTHFGGITGYPRVELDLMNETSMEITVPFNNILTHFDLVRGLGALGSVRLLVYSPLTGDAASTADVTIWMYADNIDLQLPTGMPLAPGNPADNAQSGVKEEKARPGNVETISRAIGSIASSIGSIPMLAAITAPISAVSDAVAGVASIFGFSKPQDPEFPTKSELGYAKHYTNYNGDVKAKVLALDSRNEVTIPDFISYTKEDELSLSYLVQKYTYLGRFPWTTSDVSDTVIFNVPNVPDHCVFNSITWPTGNYNLAINFNTMLSYLSGMFAFWRGSLRYKFKIIKSPFHTGRLRVDLVPGFNGVGDYVREKVYSQIVDIRETNEFEIEVPFKWNAPWKRLAIDPLVDKNFLTPTSLFIRVLNPLRNGGQSAPSVELIVEVAGGKDFQFAYPILKDGLRPLNEPMNLTAQPDNAQSGEIISTKRVGFEANSIGIGEVITSLRQVLKRYVQFPASTIDFSGDYPMMFPYRMSHIHTDDFVTTSPVVNAQAIQQRPDFYSYISYLYRFKSGSMRVAAMTDPKVTDYPVNYVISNKTLIPPELRYDSDTAPPTLSFDTLPQNFQFQQNEPFIELSIPFYQLWPAILTDVGLPNVEASSGVSIENFTKVPYNDGTELRVLSSNDDVEKMTFSRAIGEDFNFSFAIGPPITVFPVQKAPPE